MGIEILQSQPNIGSTFLFSIIAAIIAIWGIFSQRSITRRKSTLDLILTLERDKDRFDARVIFFEEAKKIQGLAVWADQSNEKERQTQSIRIVLNEFELIAIGIQRGIIDYEIYKRWNRSDVVMYWEIAAPFVYALRKRLNNPAIYHEYEELVRWMRGEAMPKRNRFIGSWF